MPNGKKDAIIEPRMSADTVVHAEGDVPGSIPWLEARLGAATIIAEYGHNPDRDQAIQVAMVYKAEAAQHQAEGNPEKARLCFAIAERWTKSVSANI